MERVEDSINGRRIAVVYDAAQVPSSRRGGRLARSRQIRRFAREQGATHVLRVRDADGENEDWWMGAAGVSFAAAIEAWVSGAPDVRGDVVVIPLDGLIYAAELNPQLRFVEREAVFGEALLAGNVESWSGRTVWGFEGGRLGATLERFVALRPAPFDVRSRGFRRLTVGLTAAGLLAPAAAVGVTALVVAVVCWRLYVAWEAVWESQGAAEEEAAAAERKALEGDFSGAAVLAAIADAAWAEDVLVLHGDGLEAFSYQGGGHDLEFRGERAAGYPAGAARYADAYGAALELAGGRWRVVQAVPWGAGDMRTVRGFGERLLEQRVQRSGEAARAAMGAVLVTADGVVKSRRYEFRIAEATAGDLRAMARGLRGLPVRVGAVRCRFEGYLASGCDVELWAKGEAR